KAVRAALPGARDAKSAQRLCDDVHGAAARSRGAAPYIVGCPTNIVWANTACVVPCPLGRCVSPRGSVSAFACALDASLDSERPSLRTSAPQQQLSGEETCVRLSAGQFSARRSSRSDLLLSVLRPRRPGRRVRSPSSFRIRPAPAPTS